MKIFIYIYYFFRSVFLRGFVNTIRLIRAEQVNEKIYGINTSSIKKSDSVEFYHYQGAGYLVLFKIFKEIAPQTNQFNFTDIGCGKGRPVFVAEHFGYSNLIGIDLDEDLIKIANENLNYYLPKNKAANIQFMPVNALDYNYKNTPTVYFFFNPFNEAILKKVVNKIIQATSSETWFVYMNPKFRAVFKTDKFEFVKEIKTKSYLEAVIYRLN